MARPQIVFVDHTAQLGGAELGLLRYLRASRLAVELSLVCLEEGPLVDALRSEGIAVDVLGIRGPGKNLRSVLALRRHFASRAPSLVVVNSLTSAILTTMVSRRRHRFVCYVNEEAIPAGAPLAARILLRHVALRRFSSFLANSQWTADTIPRALRRTASCHVVYSVSGITGTAPEVGQFHQPLRLLSLSRLSPGKGVHVILEALDLIAHRSSDLALTLTVAGAPLFGEDQYAEELRSAALALRPEVRFLGHVDDVDHVLDEHDVLIVASLVNEALGQVVLQGLARGKLVIAPDRGGPAELIASGKNGLLFRAGDSSALADAIVSVASATHSWTEVREAGVLTARRFTDQEVIRTLDELLGRMSSEVARDADERAGTREASTEAGGGRA